MSTKRDAIIPRLSTGDEQLDRFSRRLDHAQSLPTDATSLSGSSVGNASGGEVWAPFGADEFRVITTVYRVKSTATDVFRVFELEVPDGAVTCYKVQFMATSLDMLGLSAEVTWHLKRTGATVASGPAATGHVLENLVNDVGAGWSAGLLTEETRVYGWVSGLGTKDITWACVLRQFINPWRNAV